MTKLYYVPDLPPRLSLTLSRRYYHPVRYAVAHPIESAWFWLYGYSQPLYRKLDRMIRRHK